MPAYDYLCKQCDHHFEVRRSMTAPVKVEACPVCSSPDTARIYSAPNVAGSQQQKGCGGGCSSCGSGSCGTCRH